MIQELFGQTLSGQKPRLARVHKPLPEVTLKDLEEAFLGDQDDLT